MNKRVSIVVPVYNSHATLPKCLDSLISQTYPDVEIICVNDKSKDNSIEVIKEYQQKDSRVVLIDHEENKNAGGARNTGIKAATGTYVCFVDNDDWITHDAIETLIEASDDCRIDYVVPQWCEYYTEERNTVKKNLVLGGTKEENCEYALLHGCRMLGCLIRRDLFFKNDLFYPEKTFFEDNAIGVGLLYSANEIKVIDKVLYYYQMVTGSSSRSISLVKVVDRIKTTNLSESNLEGLGFVTPKNREKVDCHILCFSYFTIRMLGSIGTSEAKKHLRGVADSVKVKMPNKYLEEYHKNYIGTLKHPYLYFYIWKVAYSVKRLIKG